MAAGATMQGHRRPDGTPVHELQPGEYALSTGGGRVWLCLPSGQFGQVDSKWTITVEDDETITVSPSIFDSPDGWHGYLEHGVWRQV